MDRMTEIKIDGKLRMAALNRLYAVDAEFGHMFSVLHKQLNRHFGSINDRARTTRHYWAESSRELLALIDGIEKDVYSLKRAGIHVAIDGRLRELLCEECADQDGPRSTVTRCT